MSSVILCSGMNIVLSVKKLFGKSNVERVGMFGVLILCLKLGDV